MARTPQDVTDAELAVLQVLWDRGRASIRTLTDTLYPGGRAAHYNTVRKLLERLEAKGWVKHERSEAVQEYAATVGRPELINRRLLALAEKLCGGSLTPIFSQLVRAKRLTARERQELRELIDELDKRR